MLDSAHDQLQGKYSLESTDPSESEIRAHLRPQFLGLLFPLGTFPKKFVQICPRFI